MPVVKTSARALLIALLPVAFLQGVLLSLSEWALQAQDRSLTPDGVFGIYAFHLILNGALLMAGHVVLRHFGRSSRLAYAAMGAVAAATGYAMALRYGLSLGNPSSGTFVTAGVLPTLAGALSGFLYGQFAGLERRAAATDSTATSFQGRFDGPVRVRSSLGALALTAAIPATLIAVLAFTITQLGFVGTGSPALLTVALPAQIFLTTLFASIVPAAIFTLVAHHIARAFGLTRGIQYAAIGAAAGFVAAVLLLPFSPFVSVAFLMVPSVMLGALMGALYQRFAGLEPVPLPEAVLVTDVDALVPADDPDRRGHSIVLEG